jgi:hypothetical protein
MRKNILNIITEMKIQLHCKFADFYHQTRFTPYEIIGKKPRPRKPVIS